MEPSYVLDSMPLYEADMLLSHAYMVDQSAAERMRMVMWAALAPNSKKQLKPTDIMQFDWERKAAPPQMPSAEEFERLQAEAKEMMKKYKIEWPTN
jgi:hypothetical protein